MSEMPLLPADQWRTIEPLLPVRRRDPVMISALIFRETAAVGLRDVCDCYGVTRSRLSDWSAALEKNGTLANVLSALGLERAGPLSWRRGGVPSWRRHGSDIVGLKLNEFGRQLGRNSPRKRR